MYMLMLMWVHFVLEITQQTQQIRQRSMQQPTRTTTAMDETDSPHAVLQHRIIVFLIVLLSMSIAFSVFLLNVGEFTSSQKVLLGWKTIPTNSNGCNVTVSYDNNSSSFKSASSSVSQITPSELAGGTNNNKNINDTVKKVRILMMFLIGTDLKRVEILKRQMAIFDDRKYEEKYEVDCHIIGHGSYLPTMEILNQINAKHCEKTILFNNGLTQKIKAYHPALLKRAGYDFVSVILDDVDLRAPGGNFSILEYFDVVVKYDFAVSSPGVLNFVGWGHMVPYGEKKDVNCLIREVTMIEVQASTYRMDAYECMWEIADTEFPSGWGLDVWWLHYCRNRVRNPVQAIVDTVFVTHTKVGPLRANYNYEAATSTNQVNAWQTQRGVTLSVQQPVETIRCLLRK